MGVRVLIVDDDQGILDALVATIEPHGFEVTAVADGDGAWRLLQNERFPILLTDWLMPGMDGLELVRAIRGRPVGDYIYVIMLTGSSSEEGLRQGMEAGADDFLTKPFRGDDLVSRLTVARRIMELQGQLEDANRKQRQSIRQLEDYKRRTEHELEEAAAVQRVLLPSRVPVVDGFSFGWQVQPCEALAGDVLNLFDLQTGQVALYVLDVSGHGVGAALLSVQLSRLLSPELGHGRLLRDSPNGGGREVVPPLDVFTDLNRLFPMSSRQPRFFTVIYCLLDPLARTLRYAVAGHPGPVILPRSDRPRSLRAAGTPIGMVEHGRWTESVEALADGDRVVLFSDGLVEQGCVIVADNVSG
jgi:sigma-B regulation protein RsbU (phosphoserine phosphatase)